MRPILRKARPISTSCEKDRREYIGATERFIKMILKEEPISSVGASRAVEELSEQTLYEIFEDSIFDEQSVRHVY